MLLDVKLEKNREMMCNEAVIATMALWMGRRYEMIFSQFWRFRLVSGVSSETVPIGSRILVESGNMGQLLEEYHGIHITYHDIHDSQKIFEAACQGIKEGIPICTEIKADQIPWSLEHEKQGYRSFIITGIDEAEGIVHCLDVHYSKVSSISLNNFLQGASGYAIFSYVPAERADIDWRSVIKSSTDYLQGNKAFESMRELSRLIKISADDYKIGRKEVIDSGDYQIVEKVKDLYRSRFLFSCTLSYLINYQNAYPIGEYSKSFVSVYTKWLTIWNLLIKANFQNNFSARKELISGRILDVAGDEEELYNSLLKAISGNYTTNKPAIDFECVNSISNRINEFSFVDISSHFNNEGFATSMTPEPTANLTGSGAFILAEDMSEKGIWEVGDIKFYLPYPIDGAKDNISCNGQKIHFEKDYYSYIIFIGCAEWGHLSDVIHVHYAVGDVIKLSFEISDWFSNNPIFNEMIVWEGRCAEKTGEGVKLIQHFNAHLFAQIIRLDNTLQLDSVQLPDCDSIHIFGITLAK